MMFWDDDMIAAYVDGELHMLMQMRIEDAMAADPALAERVAVQRRLADRLRAHYAPVTDEPVPERLTALLAGAAQSDTIASDNVTSIETARSRRSSALYWVPTAIAASLAIGVFGGTFLGGGSTDPLAPRGELAQALETQLASEGGSGPVRIGVTFRNQGGAVCRTFDGTQAGYACRDGSNWHVEMLAPGSGAPSSTYRQASSGPAAVLEAAQNAMSGDPADGTEERRLRDAGWR